MARRIVGLTVLVVLLLVLGVSVYAQKKEEPKPKDETAQAKEAALDAVKKQQATKGYHIEGKINTDMGMFKVDMQLTGVYQNPDTRYMKMTLSVRGEKSEQKMEFYQKAKQSVMKEPQGKWIMSEPGASPFEMIEVFIGEYMENPKFAGEEKIKETDCKIIQSTITAEGLEKMAAVNGMLGADDAITHQAPPKFTESLFKIWIGSKDSLPYKVICSYTMEPLKPREKKPGEKEGSEEKEKSKTIDLTPPGYYTTKTSLTAELTYFDYDKDVEVKLPDEVKKLLEDK